MKNKSIVIATGGTGGHIYPGITLADALKDKGYDVSFIGNKAKMESTLIPKAGFPFYGISNQGLVGNPLVKIVRIISQVFPTIASIKHLVKIKPSRVVVFGGYVSIPVGIAAWICRIPLFLHEQNAMAGLANKVLAPLSKGIAVCYPTTIKQFSNKRTYLIGNPRGSLYKQYNDKEAFLNTLNLKPTIATVLIVMGSQGSETINSHLKSFVPLLKNESLQVILVTGKKHYKSFVNDLDMPNNCAILEHIDQLRALSYVDVMVTRAGATTVSEVIAAEVPAIFVPSPYVANNHQLKNVEALLEAKACLLLEEKDFTSSTLLRTIHSILDNDKTKKTLSENLKALATPDATNKLIEMIETS